MPNETQPKKESKWISLWIPTLSKIVIPILTIALASWGANTVYNDYTNTQTQEQNVLQEIVTLTPREGDVIIAEDGVYKLIQLISKEDIFINDSVMEVKYDNCVTGNPNENIVLINEDELGNNNCFYYRIPKVEINANKLMNLLDNVQSISVSLEFYEDSDYLEIIELSDSEKFVKEVYNSTTDSNDIFNTTFTNILTDNYYVKTHLTDPGVNYLTLKVSIVYMIDEKLVQTDYIFDEVTVTEDTIWN